MTMRFLRYSAAKDVRPSWLIGLNRCYHGKWIGIHAQRGMRCYTWIWRLCK